MSKKDSQMQKVSMSLIYRGKEIFKPLNTGWIDEHVSCIREWVANIFFYTKNGTTIMIDAGYNYDRLKEKMGWLDIDPAAISHILITHQDTDHVGALEPDSGQLFRNAEIYLSEIENRYLTGEVRRKVIFHLYNLPIVKTNNKKVLLTDGQILDFDGIKVEAILCPGHTWGHMVYLIDDEYLFTGDALWFGADGGYSFINALAEDNELAKRSLVRLEKLLKDRGLAPKIITGHTGWTDDPEFAFRHIDKVCNSLKKQKPHDPNAPYDGYDESDDTEERAGTFRLAKQIDLSGPRDPGAEKTERKSEIKSAYRSLGGAHSFYDGMMTGSTFSGRLVDKWVWCMTKEDVLEYQARAFEMIPADFSGRLLEVPVGTGVLSMPVWKTLPNAEITCLDYSEKMMASAESRSREMGIGNIHFRQGDVGALPFEDETFDAVVSLNGFHAFPDKDAAYRETFRVLKPGGIFCGSFYVQGNNDHTDKMIRKFYVKRGFFTPPFETMETLEARLEKMYSEVSVTNVQSIAVFQCRKQICLC